MGIIGLFMTSFSKVLQNSFKVIYRYQTAIETLNFHPFAFLKDQIQFFC